MKGTQFIVMLEKYVNTFLANKKMQRVVVEKQKIDGTSMWVASMYFNGQHYTITEAELESLTELNMI